ncbi:MAG: hypothetical protein FWD74_10735 [Actinomycetia bacterium]|nr:hypothetical protein [Actinomycetes bacterium]
MTAQRSHNWWVLESAEAGAVSQCRSLSQADAEMREAIAYQLDIPQDSFAIDVEVIAPDSYRQAIERSEELRDKARATAAEAARSRAQAAKELAALHISVRDIGRVMGISYQRAHQLISG